MGLVFEGVLQHTYKQPDAKDRETGEIREGKHRLQFMDKVYLENGEFKLDLIDMSTQNIEDYKPHMSKPIRFDVGVTANGDNVYLYVPRGIKPKVGNPSAS